MLFGLPLMSSLAWWFMVFVALLSIVWTLVVKKKEKDANLDEAD